MLPTGAAVDNFGQLEGLGDRQDRALFRLLITCATNPAQNAGSRLSSPTAETCSNSPACGHDPSYANSSNDSVCCLKI